MRITMIGLVAAVALLPAAAIAQPLSRSDTAAPGVPATAPQTAANTTNALPSRDGCVNVPGVPHNSANCDRIPASDVNTADSRYSTDAAGRPTGATANAARNDRIMSGQAPN